MTLDCFKTIPYYGPKCFEESALIAASMFLIGTEVKVETLPRQEPLPYFQLPLPHYLALIRRNDSTMIYMIIRKFSV